MKYRLLFLALFFASSVFAQEFSISSIVEMERDSTAITSPRYDLNDELCAVLIVELASVENITFTGAIIGKVDRKNESYLLYLPNGTKRIKLMHEDYLPMTMNFSEYGLRIRGGRTYKALVTASNPPVPENTYGSGAQYLVFKSSVPLTKVEVNGEEWPVEEGKAKKMVPLGKYEYKVSAGSAVSSGTVEVKSTATSRVVNVKFQ